MTFIRTVPEDEATGAVAKVYARDRETFGFLPNLTRAFSLRPEVYASWRQMLGALRTTMDARRYELATLAAARALRSSYCSLAHGEILADEFLDAEAVQRAAVDHGSAGLDEVDVAVMDLAAQVARDATAVSAADVERLRTLGLSDEEILDVVLAASMRCFFSKALDAVGAQPDARFAELDPGLRDVLTVGRPIEEG